MFRYPKTNIHARYLEGRIEVAYRFDGDDIYRFLYPADARACVKRLAGPAADDATIERFIDHVLAHS